MTANQTGHLQFPNHASRVNKGQVKARRTYRNQISIQTGSLEQSEIPTIILPFFQALLDASADFGKMPRAANLSLTFPTKHSVEQAEKGWIDAALQ